MTWARSSPLPTSHTLVHGTTTSTTRRWLLTLLAGIVAATGTAFATVLVVLTRTHDTAESMHTHAAPAIQGILVARNALVEADGAALRSFRSGASLVGPGEEFQTQIAIASQSLTNVAEDNIAGQAGRSMLELVDGLMVTYTGLIGQADAHLRQSGTDLLGTADLWSASNLLHKPNSGILAHLDTLLARQQQALDDQLERTAVDAGTVLLLVLPVLAMCVLLLVSQIFFRRRFRRRLNLLLMAATVLLIPMAWLITRPMSAQEDLDRSHQALYELVATTNARTVAQDGEGQRILRDILADKGCGDGRACGPTIESFFATVPTQTSTSHSVRPDLVDIAQVVSELNSAASATTDQALPVLSVTILIVIATAGAFLPRLLEYRYQLR